MAKRITKAMLIEENKRLRMDIFNILGRGSVESKVLSTTRWNMEFDIERAVWAGSAIVGKKDTGRFEDK